jgi:hypothetical protein
LDISASRKVDVTSSRNELVLFIESEIKMGGMMMTQPGTGSLFFAATGKYLALLARFIITNASKVSRKSTRDRKIRPQLWGFLYGYQHIYTHTSCCI